MGIDSIQKFSDVGVNFVRMGANQTLMNEYHAQGLHFVVLSEMLIDKIGMELEEYYTKSIILHLGSDAIQKLANVGVRFDQMSESYILEIAQHFDVYSAQALMKKAYLKPRQVEIEYNKTSTEHTCVLYNYFEYYSMCDA